MKKHLIVSLIMGLGFGFTSHAADLEKTTSNWNRNCKKCHGETGDAATALGKKLEIGDYTNPATLAEITDEELFKMTKEGVEGTKMKGYGDKLSDEEIHDLVAYMRGMAKS